MTTLSADELAAFAARCQVAVDTVQADLDRTDLSGHRLSLTMSDGWPGRGGCAYVGLPRGNVQGEFPDEYLAPEMDEVGLVEMAATNAIGSLLLVGHLRWPRCVDHPTKYMVGIDPLWHWRSTKKSRTHRGWWWCNTASADPPPHPVCPIGELEMKHIVPPYSWLGT
jgi:hypothetical protein